MLAEMIIFMIQKQWLKLVSNVFYLHLGSRVDNILRRITINNNIDFVTIILLYFCIQRVEWMAKRETVHYKAIVELMKYAPQMDPVNVRISSTLSRLMSIIWFVLFCYYVH